MKAWVGPVPKQQADLKATALEQGFNQTVLGEALGYKLHPAARASAYPKAPTSVTKIAGEPDVLLVSFDEGESQILAVLELKKPGTDLDAPQASYGNRSPVEQGLLDLAKACPTWGFKLEETNVAKTCFGAVSNCHGRKRL